MKYAALISCLVLLAVGAQSQILHDDAENTRLNTYGLNVPFPEQLGNGIGGADWPGWHGVLLQYRANPWPDAGNMSASVIEYSRNPSEVYDVVLINTGVLADVTDYVAGTKEMTLDVWSPVPGTVFQITFENGDLAAGGYPEGRHSEYQATSVTGAAWETLTFTLTGEPWSQDGNNGWWPDAATAHNDVDRMVLLINPGDQEGNTYYLDNLVGPELLVEPCTEANDNLIINDGDCNQNHWLPNYMDGRMSLVIDPAGGEGNCIEYARNGGAEDDVIVGTFGGALPLGNNPKLFMDVYEYSEPGDVVFIIQDALGSDLANVTATTTASQTWEELEFDLSGISNFPNATNFVILVAPGMLIPKTVYFDNIRIENEVGIDAVNTLSVGVYPNPSQSVLTVNAPAGFGQWQLVDTLGRIVDQGTANFGTPVEVNVDRVAPGSYTLRVVQEGATGSQQVIIG